MYRIPVRSPRNYEFPISLHEMYSYHNHTNQNKELAEQNNN